MSIYLIEAMDILAKKPLPLDGEKQIGQLEKKAPASEAAFFSDIWEGWMVAVSSQEQDK